MLQVATDNIEQNQACVREICTFDGEHGAGVSVQSLIGDFTGLIQLYVFQREETFPAFRFYVAGLKNRQQINASA